MLSNGDGTDSREQHLVPHRLIPNHAITDGSSLFYRRCLWLRQHRKAKQRFPLRGARYCTVRHFKGLMENNTFPRPAAPTSQLRCPQKPLFVYFCSQAHAGFIGCAAVLSAGTSLGAPGMPRPSTGRDEAVTALLVPPSPRIDNPGVKLLQNPEITNTGSLYLLSELVFTFRALRLKTSLRETLHAPPAQAAPLALSLITFRKYFLFSFLCKNSQNCSRPLPTRRAGPAGPGLMAPSKHLRKGAAVTGTLCCWLPSHLLTSHPCH